MAKRKFPYKNAMKALRGKVSFNYDLRKPLNRGQKANIRKAWKQLQQYKSAKLVKIKGKNKRRRAKQKLGQKGSMLTGIMIDAPSDAKIRVMKDGSLRISTKRGDQTTTEKWVGLPTDWVLSDREQKEDWIRRQMRGYDVVWPVHHGFRSRGFMRDVLGSLLDYLDDLEERYTLSDALTGFAFMRFKE